MAEDQEPTDDIWYKWASFIRRRHLIILGVVIVLTALSLNSVLKLRLEMNLKRLLPKHYESVKTLDRIVERLGGVGTIEFIVEANNWDETKRFAHAINDALLKRDDVKFVDFLRPVDFLEKYRLLYLSIDDLERLYIKIKKKINKEKLKKSSLVVELRTDEEKDSSKGENELKELEDKYSEYSRLKKYHQDDQNRYILIKMHPNVSQTNIKGSKKLYDSMMNLWKTVKEEGGFHDSARAYIRGGIRNRIVEYDTILSDVKSSALITAIAVFCLLFLCFRNVIWVFALMFSFPVSIVWTFGIVYHAFQTLNLLTVFLFVVLFGLGIDFGIHMLSRYIEGRARGQDIVAATASMFRHSGRASLTAAMTTSLAFMTLMVTDFKGFSEFGFITGLGIPLALLAMFVCLPTILVHIEIVLGRWTTFRTPAKVEDIEPSDKPFPFAKGWVTLATILAVAGVFAATKLEFEYDFGRLKMRPPDHKEVSEKYDSIPRKSNSPAIILTETPEEAAEVKQVILDHMEEDTETPTIADVKTVADIVPSDQDEKIEVLRDIDKLITPKTIEKVSDPGDKKRLLQLKASSQVRKPFTIEDVPEVLLRRFRDVNDKLINFIFIYNSVELIDGRNTILWGDDVAEITTDSGKKYFSSSNNIIFAEMMKLMIKDGQRAILSTFALVFFLLLLDLRSLNRTALVLNPLTIGIFVLLLFMVIKGIKLNFFNMVAIPSLIGMGIDYGVHLTHRYMENPKLGPLAALRLTGPAVVFSGLTTIVGYIGLVFANHPGLNSLGVVSCAGLFLSLLAALFVLPSLFSIFSSTLEKMSKRN